MPRLLNDAVQLKGTTGTNSYFITLSEAQPNLGKTPTTSTGYTLVTGANGQLQFTSTLGLIKFENGIVQTTVPNGDLTLQSTGTGRLNLTGNVYINGQTIEGILASFENFTTTNLTVLGSAKFTSATNTATFLSNVVITPSTGSIVISSFNTGTLENFNIGINEPGYGRFTYVETTGANITALTSEIIDTTELNVTTATIYQKLDAQGAVYLNSVGQDVTISPSSNGTVYINPSRTGYIDNMIIGANAKDAGFFTNLEVDNLILTQELFISTATFVKLSVTDLTVTGTSVLSELDVTGNTTLSDLTVTNSIHASSIYDSGNRVITSVTVSAGIGLNGGGTITGTNGTVILTNTGVLSLTAGTDTVITTSTGNIQIWNTSTLQSVTDKGPTTDNIIEITNTTDSTSSVTGALIVSGGVGISNNLHVGNDVYSDGGSPYYNRLLYTPKVTVDTTPPLDPRIGDFWVDPSVGVEYQLMPNGTSTIWVQFIGF